MRIAGLVAAGTGRKYGDWRHVIAGCNSNSEMTVV